MYQKVRNKWTGEIKYFVCFSSHYIASFWHRENPMEDANFDLSKINDFEPFGITWEELQANEIIKEEQKNA